MDAQYTIVFDSGMNIGLQCKNCNHIHWTSNDLPNHDCENCKLIVSLNLFWVEYPKRQEYIDQLPKEGGVS